VATFNVLHGRSVAHGGVEVADLRAAARQVDADVVGLQEVDYHHERSGGVDQTAEVAEALQARHWRFEGTSGPASGVGLVSRHPVREWVVRRFAAAPVAMPLMVPGRRGLAQVPDEPRVALAAVLDSVSGPMTVVTAHLSFVPGWNVAQLRALVRWAATLPGPRLLAGDLNLPGTVARLTSRWSPLARVATYPSWRPRVQFDHVLADGVTASAVRDVRSLRLPVSDHCALMVDLDV
jgi:endonuclease/exonuclease/phosphatase family metal-dependent hydrolase